MAHVLTTAVYPGDLKCVATHADSGATMSTSAPKDNSGDGSSFSPTDLVGVALGTCMLTTMAILGGKQGIAIDGATVETEKHMVADPKRRIGTLVCRIALPAGLTDEQVDTLRKIAESCPVKQTLSERTKVVVELSTQGAAHAK